MAPMTSGAAPVTDAWLVVPLYNEESVIGDVLVAARARFPHVVCVDDGSADASAERARAAGAVVVTHAVNLGQGAALQTGIRYVLEQTDARYLVTFDADGQHQVSDAEDMVELARREDVAVVFGSRFLDARTRPGLLKRAVLKTAVWVTNRSTGLRLTDAHNGLRVIRRDAAEQVDLRQDRMAHASEIVAQLGRTGLPWREHPVHLLYTEYSKAKGQSVLNSVNILVDLLFR
jgi:glycosyltransferase involved in cell wall biosynthesis